MVSTKKVLVGALVAATVGMFVTAPAFATTSDPRPACVDGNVKTSYVGEWTSNNTVHFKTVNNQPLCEDVTVFVGSYVMPDNYNGEPFWGNETAYPQKQFSSKKLVLKAGTNGENTVTIAVPNECKNAQMDAYIGPEIVIVGAEGHQKRAFASLIVEKTKDNCNAPEKNVEVCDPKTGKIITVKESQASNYLPKDDEACKPRVEVCNPATGQIIKVKPSEVKNYKPVKDEACSDATVEVCNPANGQTIKVKPTQVKNYKPVNDEACKPKVLATTAPEKIASTGPVDTIATTLGLGTLTGAAMYLRNFRRK